MWDGIPPPWKGCSEFTGADLRQKLKAVAQ